MGKESKDIYLAFLSTFTVEQEAETATAFPLLSFFSAAV